MPFKSLNAPRNELSILIRTGRLLSTVSGSVAESACRDDIRQGGIAAVLSGQQMFTRALQACRETFTNLVAGREFVGLFQPHRCATIAAVTVLATKCRKAGFRKVACHERHARQNPTDRIARSKGRHAGYLGRWQRPCLVSRLSAAGFSRAVRP